MKQSQGAQCEGCAFRMGTEAQQHALTQLRAQLCVLSGLPFYCHHLRDGGELGPEQRVLAENVRVLGMRPCQGWRGRVRSLAAEGYFEQDRVAKRAAGVLGLWTLDVLVRAEKAAERRAARRILRSLVSAFVKARARGKEATDA